jgi:hypothetical protein
VRGGYHEVPHYEISSSLLLPCPFEAHDPCYFNYRQVELVYIIYVTLAKYFVATSSSWSQ